MLGFIHITKTGGTNIKDKNKNKEIIYGNYHNENAEYYKNKNMKCFSIIRNPLDRYISLFYYNTYGSNNYNKNNPIMNINDFVNKHYNNNLFANFENGTQFRKQISWLNNGDPNNTFIILYDKKNLIDTIRDFCKNINIDFIYDNYNNINETKYKNYQELTEESKQKIKEMYKEDYLFYDNFLKVNKPYCKLSEIILEPTYF
jgi:hypothetical protein